jgi:PadR family transcriptional regulator, regulatory protein AphA
MSELNTTSYAILSLLAVRPWTTYELAKQMDRSLSWFWPRATSVLYTEPKKLVAHGLATVSRQHTGRRPRTVYQITPKGRERLRAWLDRPGTGPTLEFEALVQVAFADHGSKQQLLATLASIRRQADARREEAIARAQEYATTGGPFPERLHVIALVGRFLLDHTELVAGWAAWAERQVDRWPGVTAGDGAPVAADAFQQQP